MHRRHHHHQHFKSFDCFYSLSVFTPTSTQLNWSVGVVCKNWPDALPDAKPSTSSVQEQIKSI